MKTIEEIYQALTAEFCARTGLSSGGSGDLAVRFYAVAAQLYGLYAQADWVNRQCFPQTAEGEALDNHAALRGLSRREAGRAAGTVRFFAGEQRSQAAVIPAGTVCMTAEGVRYVTTREGEIPVGETVLDLPVEAVEPGEAYNAAEGRVVWLTVAPAGITGCTNPQPITGGQDAEEDEALRQRVLETYRRLSNGGNAAFYEQEALSFDEVAAVKVLPKNRGVGTVDVVVAARGGMPGQELLERLQDHFDLVREIAVDVAVTAPDEKAVNVAVELTVEAGHSFEQVAARVRSAVEGRFTGALLGRPVYQAELTALVFGVDGVANCAVTVEGGDVSAGGVTLPCLGQLTVTGV